MITRRCSGLPYRGRAPAAGMLVLALVASSAAASVPVQAAVRVCKPHAAGEEAMAASMQEARRQALMSWTRIARAFGPEFTAWRLAQNRRISCRRTASGHVCQARGRPCSLRQVPPGPAQPVPPRRRRPSDGVIEA